ncbi:hypothetical protein [Sphingobium sp. Z007]|uniref:hypothetical protein n=1 Tax=Sphingobium sp. Z007 TaxID=627495 RepID=UPI000B49FBBC|nr:hypothetical protein [Sphingobium sp. Z007]
MNSILNISPKLLAYLKSWHSTSTGKQAAAGHTVNLPFQDFLDLFEPRQLKTLQDAIDANRIRYLQNEDNKFAFVLTWKSYAARSTGQFNKDTATICSRQKSATINLPQSGDTLRDDHKAAISAKLSGVAKSDEHRANMSAAAKGSSKVAWTSERKEARKQQIAAKKAAEAATRKSSEDAAWARLDAARSQK